MIFRCSAKGVFFRRNADVDRFVGVSIGDSIAPAKFWFPPGSKIQYKIATAIAGLIILGFCFRFFFVVEILVVFCRLIEDIRDREDLPLVMAEQYARRVADSISLVNVSKSKKKQVVVIDSASRFMMCDVFSEIGGLNLDFDGQPL